MSLTNRCRPAGSSEAGWSEPYIERSNVICLSIEVAPRITAATHIRYPKDS